VGVFEAALEAALSFSLFFLSLAITIIALLLGMDCDGIDRTVGVASEQDKLPSSVGLDLQARLNGRRMYSGHLEAKRLH
ncbi:hypothetical protein Tco_0070570, partial [Tanacetum coccineum]